MARVYGLEHETRVSFLVLAVVRRLLIGRVN